MAQNAMAGMQMPQVLLDIQKKVDESAQEIKKIELEYQKVVQGKRSLTEKKSENEMVMSEFNLVEKD